MIQEELVKLPIEHVSEKRYLGGVYHNGDSKPCLFCHATRYAQAECRVLGNQEIKSLLFERLIELNSIRLNWLYRTPKLN